MEAAKDKLLAQGVSPQWQPRVCCENCVDPGKLCRSLELVQNGKERVNDSVVKLETSVFSVFKARMM
jgi:hypothetical protein